MTKPSSFDACGSLCANSAGPPTPNEIADIIARLRAAGARVINARGEDLQEGDIAALLKEWS
jgi:hypothetical protein